MTEIVADIMQTDVTMVAVDATVEEAEKRLLQYHRRCAPVVDDQRNCFGVISYSDILRLRSENANLKLTNVWEVCSPRVRSVSPACSVKAATDLMLEHNIHHVLVLQEKRVRGIVSVMDVITAHRKQLFADGDPEAAQATAG